MTPCCPRSRAPDPDRAETAPAMLMALETGTVDFICTDMPTAMGAVAAYPDMVILDFTDSDDNFVADEGDINIGVSVMKGNTALKGRHRQRALLHDRGRLQRHDGRGDRHPAPERGLRDHSQHPLDRGRAAAPGRGLSEGGPVPGPSSDVPHTYFILEKGALPYGTIRTAGRRHRQALAQCGGDYLSGIKTRSSWLWWPRPSAASSA